MLQPILQSTYMRTIWPEATLTADEPPAAGGAVGIQHGIHAVLPEHRSTYLCNLSTMTAPRPLYATPQIRAIGAVDLWGVIQEHEDGVVRAEHCRILALSAVIIPPGQCCLCRRLVVLDDAYEPLAYKLRVPCTPNACEGRAFGPHLTPVASLDARELTAQLLRYYEVAPLPEGEGPWYGSR